jgi:hypothetical protein
MNSNNQEVAHGTSLTKGVCVAEVHHIIAIKDHSERECESALKFIVAAGLGLTLTIAITMSMS